MLPILSIKECAIAATLQGVRATYPMPTMFNDMPWGCYILSGRQSNTTSLQLNLYQGNAANGAEKSTEMFNRYPICSSPVASASSEKGLYCSRHFEDVVGSFVVLRSKLYDSGLLCMGMCWAESNCWGCSAFCKNKNCVWHALKECGELVTALGDGQYPVLWKPSRGQPAKGRPFIQVRWILSLVSYLLLVAVALMRWWSPWVSVCLWKELLSKRFHVKAVCFSPFHILGTACMGESLPDLATKCKVKSVIEERRYGAAMVFSSISIGLQLLHLLFQATFPEHMTNQFYVLSSCCRNEEAVQEADMLALAGTLAPLLFVSVHQSRKKHRSWAINFMVWVTCLTKMCASLHAFASPDCGHRPNMLYKEVASRVFLLICVQPWHASILAILLSVIHTVLVVHYVPVDAVRFSSESCHALLRTGDLQDLLHLLSTLVTNISQVLPHLNQSFYARWTFELLTLMDQNARTNDLIQEAVIAILVIVLICAVNLIMGRSLEQCLRLQDTKVQLRAVSNVLSLLCDAVVHLGPDHKIIAPSPKLVSLLHSAPSAAAYEGSDFCSFLQSKEDCSRLTEALDRGESNARESSPFDDRVVLQVGMRDALGVGFRAELFHTCFEGVDGQLRYLVGINEVGERLHNEPVQDMFGSLPLGQHNLQEIQSSESGSSSEITPGSLAAELPLWFECSKQCCIVRSSISETDHQNTTAPRGSALFHALWRHGDFVTWAQSTTCSVLDDANPAESTAELTASFRVQAKHWKDSDLPPCTVALRASCLRSEEEHNTEDVACSLVRFETVSIERGSGLEEMPSFWFDVGQSGDMVGSSLSDDDREETCTSWQLLDALLTHAPFAEWLRTAASELRAGRAHPSASAVTTSFKNPSAAHRLHPYTLTVSAELLQNDKGVDIDSCNHEPQETLRVTITSDAEDRSLKSPRDQGKGTPALAMFHSLSASRPRLAPKFAL